MSDPSPILKYFAFEHLPDGPMKATSMMFHNLAHQLETRLPPGAEKSVALRKLLEAKDAAVRASIP